MIRRSLRAFIHRSPFFDAYRRARGPWDLWCWQRRSDGSKGTPPPLFKQNLVRHYGRVFQLPTLIETGVLFGDMIAAQLVSFSTLLSIELDPALVERAARRFRHHPHVTILWGDSAATLPSVCKSLSGPALFWLDAHSMVGGVRGALVTPIRAELEAVLREAAAGSVVLIDDARLFQGRGDWPNLDEVRDLVARHRPDWIFEVRDDVIRTHAPRTQP